MSQADGVTVERLLQVGAVDEALAIGRRLLEQAPADPAALQACASAMMAAGDSEGAATLFEELLRHCPETPGARGRYAVCLAALGRVREAHEAFFAALAQAPANFLLRLAHAELLEADGRLDDAVTQYFRAVFDAQRTGRWLSDATTAPAMRERVNHAMDVVDAGRREAFERLLKPHVDAYGPVAMARVADALAVHLGLTTAPMRDPRQQPKFFWMPQLPPTGVFERAVFPWYEALESAFPAITGELGEALGGDGIEPFLGPQADRVADVYLGGAPNRAWNAYFFHRHGEPFADHLARCPRTAAALEAVPLTRIAGHAPEVLFSVLAPQTHIKPHYGVTNTRVVTHLPLLIPEGDCRLVVGGEAHAWEAGRCITFDDSFLHEAWNRSDEVRVVMILDTWNPELHPEECAALKDLVEGIGAFNRRAGIG